MKPFLPFLLVSLLVAALPAEEKAPPSGPLPGESVEAAVSDYIRYIDGEDGGSLLQTAVTRFLRGETVVDLVSVVHLGDAAYYEGLNDYFTHFDAVLYEMVGGSFDEKQEEAALGAAATETDGLRQMQVMASSLLGLEFQLDGIDYEAANLVHADVNWEQYHQLMDARNQSFATLFSRAMTLTETTEIPGLPTTEAGMQMMLGRLFNAVATGNSDELKRTLAPFLAESETLIAQLEGDDGTVLVSERNRVVMERLAAVERERGAGSYAIFYGAGHMPDLEDRLLAEGFRKVETGWLNAWSIGAPEAVAPAPGEVNMGDFLLELLRSNPEAMEAIRGLEESLREVREGSGQ